MTREVVQIRVKDAQKEAWRFEAMRCGMELTGWMKWVLDSALLPSDEPTAQGCAVEIEVANLTIDLEKLPIEFKPEAATVDPPTVEPIGDIPEPPVPVQRRLVLCSQCDRNKRVKGIPPLKGCPNCEWR